MTAIQKKCKHKGKIKFKIAKGWMCIDCQLVYIDGKEVKQKLYENGKIVKKFKD